MIAGQPKSKLVLLLEANSMKKLELDHTMKMAAAKDADGSKIWRTLIQIRREMAESSLNNLDSSDPEFKKRFDRCQAIRDEYSLLQGMLADPEKRAEKIRNEMAKNSEEIKRLTKQETEKAADQY